MNTPVVILFALTVGACAVGVRLALVTNQVTTGALVAAVLTVGAERLSARIGDSDRAVARRIAARKAATS